MAIIKEIVDLVINDGDKERLRGWGRQLFLAAYKRVFSDSMKLEDFVEGVVLIFFSIWSIAMSFVFINKVEKTVC